VLSLICGTKCPVLVTLKMAPGSYTNTLEHLQHYSCGNVKAHMAEKVKWSCDKCKTEKFQRLQEDLQNALRQIDELKTMNGDGREVTTGGSREEGYSAFTANGCQVHGDW
jgi:predicted  nucleic acid-binding Zn-ribbon protein